MDQVLAAATAASTTSSRDASHPELYQGKWSRKYGRYDFHRFDHVSSEHFSVGGKSVGKVDVDCKLLFKRSRWGVLGGRRPAGIIYMDLDFHQPEGYRLAWATVQVALDDDDRESLRSYGQAPPAEPEDSTFETYFPVQITPWFGPQHIVGHESILHKAETVSLLPHIEAAGIGLGGMGKKFHTSSDIPFRWKFTGHLVRPDEKATSGQYKTLEWQLKENDLDPGLNSRVHTAFAYEYGNQPFLMKVKVRGGLRQLHHRFKHNVKSLRFGPRPNQDADSSITLINAYHGRRLPLDALARSLDRAMELENYKTRPLELPKPQQATFEEVKPDTETPPEANHGPQSPVEVIADQPLAQLQPPPATTEVDELAASLLPDPDDYTAPTLGNLARAGRNFLPPSREITFQGRTDISSSTATLVEQGDTSSTYNLPEDKPVLTEEPKIEKTHIELQNSFPNKAHIGVTAVAWSAVLLAYCLMLVLFPK